VLILLSFNKCNTSKGTKLFDLKYKMCRERESVGMGGGCTEVVSIGCRSGVMGRYTTEDDKSQQQTQTDKYRNSYNEKNGAKSKDTGTSPGGLAIARGRD